MTEHELGTLVIASHEHEELTAALGIVDTRFDDIVEAAHTAWNHGESISESIDYLFSEFKLSGSEAVLALMILGRVWEQTENLAET